jgi:hypothetical protein
LAASNGFFSRAKMQLFGGVFPCLEFCDQTGFFFEENNQTITMDSAYYCPMHKHFGYGTVKTEANRNVQFQQDPHGKAKHEFLFLVSSHAA